jgi:multidrug efflux pump subunit AcrA (membrane-fusion protein)
MKKNLYGALAMVPILLISGAVTMSCSGGKKDAGLAAGKPEGDAPAAVFAVNTTTATRGQIRDYLMLSGDIVAGSTVDAYPEVAGKVTRLFVSIGDRVQKDAPLAEVDPSRPGMTYIPAVVKAPIAGTIVALPAQLGMTVSQASPVARLSGTGSLELRTFVAERFVSKIRLGLKAEIGLDAYPGQNFLARVTELSPVLDPSSRTMEIRLKLPGQDARLKAGMFAKVKVITAEKTGIVKIPANAVVKRFGESYVFSVSPDPADPAQFVARRSPVTTGILIDDQQEILSGLAAAEEIVVRGQSLLEDGSRVKVIDRLAPLPASD